VTKLRIRLDDWLGKAWLEEDKGMEIFLTDGLPQFQYTQQPLQFCQFQLAYAGYYSVSQMTKALEAEVYKLEETKKT
jgi:hypothetical protein